MKFFTEIAFDIPLTSIKLTKKKDIIMSATTGQEWCFDINLI